MNGFPLWRKQVFEIVGLEWKKTLFSRRGLWVYALAFLPALLFGMNAIRVKKMRMDQEAVLQAAPNAPALTAAITPGISANSTVEILNKAHVSYSRFTRGKRREFIRFQDGSGSYELVYREGVLVDKRTRDTANLSEDIRAFAGIYQYFFLRLAIFFGCVGIFMNLFRGEMLDQSLHYYLLSPVRREVLMVGKYLSGIAATSLIFCSSVALQLFLMLSAHNSKEVADYLAGPGWGHIFSYVGVAALACIGYGSIFLAAGIVMRNPLIPAAVILFWEGANWFLPAVLQKISIIHYLQSLSPIVAPIGSDIPDALKLLITTAAPTPAPIAIVGLLAVSAAVLFVASRYIRKIEINYGTD